MKLDKELLKYEMPTIAEFISIGWLQTIIAKYAAWKVNRKWKRYQRRVQWDSIYGKRV